MNILWNGYNTTKKDKKISRVWLELISKVYFLESRVHFFKAVNNLFIFKILKLRYQLLKLKNLFLKMYNYGAKCWVEEKIYETVLKNDLLDNYSWKILNKEYLRF